MKIGFGNDYTGIELKNTLMKHLKEKGYECIDYGAAVCSEPYSAKMTAMHNDSNIIAMGARVVGSDMAKMIVDEFFETEYEGGRHEPRVQKISEVEAKYMKDRDNL